MRVNFARGTPTMLNIKAKEDILAAVLRAYREQREDLPDSDLDNEQPVSLNIRTTLGHLRTLRMWDGR